MAFSYTYICQKHIYQSIISDENNVSSSGVDSGLDKKEKKGKNIIGLLRVAVSLCNCLSKKYVKETEGIWV